MQTPFAAHAGTPKTGFPRGAPPAPPAAVERNRMERRTSPRIPLDAPCLLTLVIEKTTAYPVMLTDISRGGMQLALPPDVADDAVSVNAEAALRDAPAPARDLLEGARGRVAWIARRYCGLRLDRELPATEQELARIFHL